MALVAFVLAMAAAADGRIFMNHFAVRIEGGTDVADAVASEHGFDNTGQIGSLKDYYLFEHKHVSKRSTEHSHKHNSILRNNPKVLWAEQQVELKRSKRDDEAYLAEESSQQNNRASRGNPLFAQPAPPGGYPSLPSAHVSYSGQFPDPLYPEQWYLHQGAQDGWDMNVVGAWRKGYTGRGVVVSILDDGVQTNHPDLIRNYDPMASYDINGNDPDPMPQDNGDNKHGTRCAGEVSATAFNNVCGIGIAFNSSIGGVRMLDGSVNDAVEARALSLNPQHIDIYSASWGPEDDGKTVDGPGPLARRAFIDGVSMGRGGRGSIFVWASGNGGRHTDNCNCDGYTNSIFTLSISSVTQRGTKPWYLEECSSTVATTYSSGTPGHDKNVVTVDMDPTMNPRTMCTKDHTGTSASAPIAAALCALTMEANPNLTWRDMQFIVILTSRPEPLKKEDGWITNAVNRQVSHKFGYGLMDATAMVNLAERWLTVPVQHICDTQEDNFQKQIPNGYGQKLEVFVRSNGCWNTPNVVNYLEHVQAHITLRYNPRGNLKIILESPMGTRSVLLFPRPRDLYQTDFDDWPFLSVHFWGEKAAGQWKLTILNAGPTLVDEPGILKKWSLMFYGTKDDPMRTHSDQYHFAASNVRSQAIVKVREDQQSQECDEECRNGCRGKGPDKCTDCRHLQGSSMPRTCLRRCNQGTYVDEDRVCQPCHSSCKACNGPGPVDCLDCLPTLLYVESQGECQAECPATHYKHPNESACFPCGIACASCVGRPDNCTSCKPDLFSHQSSCVTFCPHQTYEGPDQKCWACHSLCETCTGPAILDCVTCPRTSVHLNGSCLRACPPGYFTQGINNECYSCEPSCSTCNSSQCLSCPSGWVLDFRGSCSVHTTCGQGKYLRDDDCLACNALCKTCSGPEYWQCLSCPSSSYLLLNTCVPICPNGTYVSQRRSCLACHETCSACSGNLASDCSSCKVGLLHLDGKMCRTVCGDRMFADSGACRLCHTSCLTCWGERDTNCITCPQGLELAHGRCGQGCPQGTYPVGHDTGTNCLPCSHPCAECQGSGFDDCLTCRDDLVLDGGLCMSCNPGMFYEKNSKKCEQCHFSCTTCNGPGPNNCLACTEPLKPDHSRRRCVPCCYPTIREDCCNCDALTGACMETSGTDKRRIPAQVADGNPKVTSKSSLPFSLEAFAAVALLTCLGVVAIFLAAVTFLKRNQTGCWRRSEGYHRLPIKCDAGMDRVDIYNNGYYGQEDNDEDDEVHLVQT